MNSWKKLKKILSRTPNHIAVFLIEGYRLVLSPSVGILRYLPFYPKPSCIFYPTCSEYAKVCFKKYPFFTAMRKGAHRIAQCTPHNEPSVDLP